MKTWIIHKFDKVKGDKFSRKFKSYGVSLAIGSCKKGEYIRTLEQ